MKRSLFLFLFFLLAGASELVAQQVSVSGKVISEEDGQAMPGINIVVKGTNSGTVTDISGAYRLAVPSNLSHTADARLGCARQDRHFTATRQLDLLPPQRVEIAGEKNS